MNDKKALNFAWYVVGGFVAALIVLMLIASRIGI